MAFCDRLSPRKTSVFPVPVAVSVRPEAILVKFPKPIESVELVPARVMVRVDDIITFPVPRSRLLDEVLFAVPNVKSLNVIALFPRLVIAAPLVLAIVTPALIVRAPVPSALAWLILRVPAVRVTPPAAPELFPLRVKVPPPIEFIVVTPP